ncbi:MAG: AMP-binding protein, partial [bacterium]|nr:AMP-binding protein [bacterium]
MPEIIPVGQETQPQKLTETFAKIIKRHESLRTTFHLIHEQPVQRIHENVELKIEPIEIKEEQTPPREDLAGAFKKFVRPFDLARPPLLRVALVKRGKQNHLFVDMHHIISDGISHSVLEEDFGTLYKGETLTPLKIQYKDYSRWQNREQGKQGLKQQQKYWQERFGGEVPQLNLPTDFIRPKVQGYQGTAVQFELSPEKEDRLRTIASEENATHFMVQLTLFSILLSKLGGQEDIVIGTPVAGRRHADLEKIIGMFVNTLALRNYPQGEKTFKQYLHEVTQHTLTDFENQEYQFEDLVENLSITRDAARNPLFDVMLTMQNNRNDAKNNTNNDTPGKKAGPGPAKKENISRYRDVASKFDMTLNLYDTGAKLSLVLICNNTVFEKETIHRFINYYKRLLTTVTGNAEIKLSQIRLMDAEEKKRVLYEFNATKNQYPENKTIHGMFEEQAVRTPRKIAAAGPTKITANKTGCAQLTYTQLNEKAQRLSHRLRTGGLGPGTVAAIMLEPSLEMITAILAVLKTGACYLPIDPLNPQERTNFLLNDSETTQLLTHPQQALNLTFDGEIIDIAEEIDGKIEENNPGHHTIPSDPVYMIYTSGTTGKPKGVVLKHSNLVNYVHWFSQKAAINSEDKTILTSSFAFDLGYTSLYPSLLTGAQLHLLPKETYMEPGRLLQYIAHHGITYLNLTPSLFSTIVADTAFNAGNVSTLRLVLLGGEAINTADVETSYRECPHTRIMNHYGPSEVTIGCIAQYIEIRELEAYKTRPTIGTPINNTKAFILDKYQNP